MEQINLFETIDERIRRSEEVRHPWVLAVRTSSHVGKLLVLSVPLVACALLLTWLFYGQHDKEEEIVVISTPLMLSYLGIRLARTRIPPASENEIASAGKATVQEVLAGLFAVGILLIALAGLSSLIYGHFGIQWAEHASRSFVKGALVGMALLAVAFFLVSDHSRRIARKLLRIFIAIPGLAQNHVGALIPPRLPIRFGHRLVLLASSSFVADLLRSARGR